MLLHSFSLTVILGLLGSHIVHVNAVPLAGGHGGKGSSPSGATDATDSTNTTSLTGIDDQKDNLLGLPCNWVNIQQGPSGKDGAHGPGVVAGIRLFINKEFERMSIPLRMTWVTPYNFHDPPLYQHSQFHTPQMQNTARKLRSSADSFGLGTINIYATGHVFVGKREVNEYATDPSYATRNPVLGFMDGVLVSQAALPSIDRNPPGNGAFLLKAIFKWLITHTDMPTPRCLPGDVVQERSSTPPGCTPPIKCPHGGFHEFNSYLDDIPGHCMQKLRNSEISRAVADYKTYRHGK